MSKPRRSVFVNGKSYQVQECPGILKANVGGLQGWTTVWAESYTALVKRIKWAMNGGQ